MLLTGTSTGLDSAAAAGSWRLRNGPCPHFLPGRLGLGLRLPLEKGLAERDLLRKSLLSFSTS